MKGHLEFDRDYAFCEAVGGMAAHGMMSDKYWLMLVDVARALTAQHELQRCMEHRGWTTVSLAARHRRVSGLPSVPGREPVQREPHAQTM
jgi:hypothetical protein